MACNEISAKSRNENDRTRPIINVITLSRRPYRSQPIDSYLHLIASTLLIILSTWILDQSEVVIKQANI